MATGDRDSRLKCSYAYDEREKIRRLIKLKEDFRSAFLRAHGLSETLVKARLLRRWHRNEVIIRLGNNDKWQTRDALTTDGCTVETLNALDGALGRCEMVWTSKLLRKKLKEKDLRQCEVSIATVEADGRRQSHKETAVFKHDDSIKPMEEFYVHDKQFWSSHQFSKLRNLAIHFCLSFSRELALKSFTMVQKNLDEFAKNWLDIVPGKPDPTITADGAKDIENAVTNSRPTWSDLSEACGLTLLPDLDAIQSTEIETTEDCGGGTEKAGDQAGNQNDGDKHDAVDSPTVEVAP